VGCKRETQRPCQVDAITGMLQCWRGSGRVLMLVRDDWGGGCAVALLMRRQCYWGVRAVAGMGPLARRCWDRRTAVPGLKREVTISMLLEGAYGKAQGLGGPRHPPWPPLETISLVPAEVPRQCSLQGWRLSCGSKEEVCKY
jgi:hypothetical protein